VIRGTVLELDRVTKCYAGSPPVVALGSVTLRVCRGEMLAVVGPSGSGKSTLLAIAGTLERASSGDVRVAGAAVGHLGDRELAGIRAHAIGFVFQQFFLVPTLTALDNVATGLLYRGIDETGRRRAARAALDAVGLGRRTAHRPGALSGGECQRVAIARALVGEPAVILADEPTGNVDSRQGAEIVELLRELNRLGSTIVVVTHNEGLARGLPRTVRMRDGIVEHDSGATG